MKLRKSLKNKLTAVLATGVLMTSMVGCTSKTKEASLNELTITHVTSPLNVPSIIQKNKNIFEEILAAVLVFSEGTCYHKALLRDHQTLSSSSADGHTSET